MIEVGACAGADGHHSAVGEVGRASSEAPLLAVHPVARPGDAPHIDGNTVADLMRTHGTVIRIR
jgi:hypothetical protein